eukprot:1157296-Pelagomonas_calceolata.AAC.12
MEVFSVSTNSAAHGGKNPCKPCSSTHLPESRGERGFLVGFALSTRAGCWKAIAGVLVQTDGQT